MQVNLEPFGGSMYRKYFICFAFTLSVALLVTADRTEAASQQYRPSDTNLTLRQADSRGENITPSAVGPPEPRGGVTLQDVLSLALAHNPDLASFSIEVRAADARALQAGLRPNPELSVETENIFGRAEMRRFDSAETTLEISQLIEVAGKRPKRMRVASLERDLAGWDYEASKSDVLTETAKSFVDVLEAQERLALTEELLRLAEQVFDIVSQRVKAGKVSPMEETKAGVVLSNSRIERERARRALEAARKRLAVAWGSGTPTYEKVIGRLEPAELVPPTEEMTRGILRNPDIARWDTELAQRRAEIALQEANRIPDLSLGGGVRHFNETDDRAFVLGASIPLPLFNRNQGEILASRHQLAKAKKERGAAEGKVRAAIAEIYGSLSTATTEIEILKTTIIPGAQSVFEAASEGYRLGKFGFLDVLDAQRTLFEAKGQ